LPPTPSSSSAPPPTPSSSSVATSPCQYQASWCNNKPISDVYTAELTKDQVQDVISSWANGKCFFITSASGNLQAADATGFKINGAAVTCDVLTGSGASFNTCVSSINKADGGYYIFLSASTWMTLKGSANSFNGLNPNCN
jgi:hypothetical protein